jgi:hypothetical protein
MVGVSPRVILREGKMARIYGFSSVQMPCRTASVMLLDAAVHIVLFANKLRRGVCALFGVVPP